MSDPNVVVRAAALQVKDFCDYEPTRRENELLEQGILHPVAVWWLEQMVGSDLNEALAAGPVSETGYRQAWIRCDGQWLVYRCRERKVFAFRVNFPRADTQSGEGLPR